MPHGERLKKTIVSHSDFMFLVNTNKTRLEQKASQIKAFISLHGYFPASFKNLLVSLGSSNFYEENF